MNNTITDNYPSQSFLQPMGERNLNFEFSITTNKSGVLLTSNKENYTVSSLYTITINKFSTPQLRTESYALFKMFFPLLMLSVLLKEKKRI